MRKTLIALLAATGFTMSFVVSGAGAARADNVCFSCWAGAAIVLGGIRVDNAGYASGHLPGIYSPYYGYAPGYYGYPPPHAHLPAYYAPRGGPSSVRYANRVRFVQPAAFDPARIKR